MTENTSFHVFSNSFVMPVSKLFKVEQYLNFHFPLCCATG